MDLAVSRPQVRQREDEGEVHREQVAVPGPIMDVKVVDAVYLLDANQNLIQTYAGDFDQSRLAKEIGEVDSIYNKREADRS